MSKGNTSLVAQNTNTQLTAWHGCIIRCRRSETLSVRFWLMTVQTGLAPSIVANSVSGRGDHQEDKLAVSHSHWVKWYDANIKLSSEEAGESLIAVFLGLQWFYNPYFKLLPLRQRGWELACRLKCVKYCCSRHFNGFSSHLPFRVLGTRKVSLYAFYQRKCVCLKQTGSQAAKSILM